MAMGFAAIGIFLLFYLAFIVAIYVLEVFGTYRMASHAGIPNAWLAFVPIGNGYVTGLLAERACYTYTGKVRRLALWNVVFQSAAAAGAVLLVILAAADSNFNALVGLSVLAIVGGAIGAMVVLIYSLYYIFKDYSPDNAVLFTILGVFFGIYWIFLLVEMNRVPVSVTGFGAYPYGRPKYDKYHQWPQTPPQAPGYYGAGYAPGTGAAPGYYPPQGGYSPTTGPENYQQQYPGQGPAYGQGPDSYRTQQPPAAPPQSAGSAPSQDPASSGYEPRDDEKGGQNGPEL